MAQFTDYTAGINGQNIN